MGFQRRFSPGTASVGSQRYKGIRERDIYAFFDKKLGLESVPLLSSMLSETYAKGSFRLRQLDLFGEGKRRKKLDNGPTCLSGC